MRSSEVRAVILAGGRGTRFWPLGRAKKPKQFFPICSHRSMVEETVVRIEPVVPRTRIWMVADALQTRTLRKVFPKLPRGNFLVEPQAKNTAPSLMMATAKAWLENPETVVVALPADHVIQDKERFVKKIEAGIEAASREKTLVIYGIPPTYPATGYGYIRYSKEGTLKAKGEVFYQALSFKEKPSLDVADQYLAQGDSFWNSGMFIWEADVFARMIAAFSSELHPVWEKMVKAIKRRNGNLLLSAFREAPAVSIDHALMEKAEGVLVGEGDFGWSDIGAWSSLFDIWARDKSGNAARGETMALEARDCLVYNPGKLTALVGVKDLIVVNTEDALLICSADRDQRVKELVDILRKKNAKYL